jgi:hypothetical protein
MIDPFLDLRPDVVLRASDRVTSDDYPGVLVSIGDSVRVVLNLDLDAYLVQHRGSILGGGVVWMSSRRGCKSLRELLAKFSASVPRLASACNNLPDDPSLSFPAFSAARAELLAGFDANRWSRDDYARVVGIDGNLRLVVEPSGSVYRLQWLSRSDFLDADSPFWKSVKMSSDLSEIRSFMELRILNTHDWNGFPCPDLVALFYGLPRFASEGVWPSLPARPS